MYQAILDFFDWVGKRTLPTLILLSALSVSGSAAFYSVSGLSKLFAGASFEVMIMAGSLEVAKLVTATLLHRYWSKLSILLRSYLTLAVLVLVVITSMGIYGFLSAAYQDTFRALTVKNNQVAFLEQKKEFYEKDVERYDDELARISANISTLSGAKATSIQVRDTTVAGGVRSTISTAELRAAQRRIQVEEENRKEVQARRVIAADSLQKYQLEILDLENNTEVAGELGPLEYLSGLTGVPMDKIINYLLLVIIFVFDPLAISLVIAANFAFMQIQVPSTKSTRKEVEEVLERPKMTEQEVEDWQEEFLQKHEDYDDQMYPEEWLEEMDEQQRLYQIYGETGSLDPRDLDVDYETVEAPDWEIEQEEHSDFEDAEKNIILEEEDPVKRVKDLEAYLAKERIGGINPRLEKDLMNEINTLKKQLSQDEDEDPLTITY